MTTQIQRRRGTTTEHGSFTGAVGEITIDTTKDTVVVHDGSTAGGHPLAKENNPKFTGNVGIGVSSPTRDLQLGDNTSSAEVISLQTSTSGTGSIYFGDNTATSAEYAGMIRYSHSDDAMQFRTSSTERLNIDSSGHLNFRQESASSPYPEQKLKWSNDSTTASGFYISQDTGRNGRVWHEQGLEILFGTSNTERMRIDPNGNVGIGTSTPGLVSGMTKYLTLSATGSGQAVGLELAGNRTGGNQTSSRISFVNNTAEVAKINCSYQGSTTLGSLEFHTSGSQKAIIDSAGNVGIGTTSPAMLLDLSNSSNAYIRQTRGSTTFRIGPTGSSATSGAIVATETNGPLTFATNGLGNERLRIDSSGNIGIGTTSPASNLHVKGNNIVQYVEATGTAAEICFRNNTSTGDNIRIGGSGNNLTFDTGGSERVRIDSSGRLLVGTSTARATGGSQNRYLQVEGTSYATAGLSLTCNSTSNAPTLNFGRSRGTSVGSSTVVQNGDDLGFLTWSAADGTDLVSYAAQIHAEIDGTPGSNDTPGRLIFSTTADGNAGVSERMRIDSSGNVLVGKTASSGLTAGCELRSTGMGLFTRASGNPVQVRRLTDDGDLVEFYQDSSLIGSIGVSGSSLTVGMAGPEKLRIDSSGRILVGTTSSIAVAGAETALQVEGTTADTSRISVINRGNNTGGGGIQIAKSRGTQPALVQNNDQVGGIFFAAGDATDFVSQPAKIECFIDGAPSGSDTPGRLTFSTCPDGSDTPTERMRIDNLGRIFTYNANTGNNSLTVESAATAGTAVANFIGAYGSTGINTGTSSFIVWTNGNVVNTNNSYGAISDAKLKENIVDASSQWDDIKDLRVRNYNFIEGQTHTQIGVVAQEVETVSPGLVTESPDLDAEGNDLGTTTKSVNYSVLYMKAVKALQEAMDRIETLETKVAALEAG